MIYHTERNGPPATFCGAVTEDPMAESIPHAKAGRRGVGVMTWNTPSCLATSKVLCGSSMVAKNEACIGGFKCKR